MPYAKNFLAWLHGALAEKYRIKKFVEDGGHVSVPLSALFESCHPVSDDTSCVTFWNDRIEIYF